MLLRKSIDFLNASKAASASSTVFSEPKEKMTVPWVQV